MSVVRWMLANKLKELGYAVTHTYGYLTKSNRIALGLPKTHANDAFCIAGAKEQVKADKHYLIKFERKCNRSLFKANPLKGGRYKRNTVKQAFGFKRFDKVLYKGIECFIHGLRTSGYFDLRTIIGEKIGASVSYKALKLLEHFKTYRIALLSAVNSGACEL
jgi:hypothetical protein